jgi:Protein of unknown function DUF262
MPRYSPGELRMWNELASSRLARQTDDEINRKYAKRELRIVTETNREQLPNFVEALRRPGWMNLQPFYQRRRRWDDHRKSKLIESFIMNVPVPPFFLFESEFARYEVMDGQQRISAILDFYQNHFRLKGLEQWPELNGRIYSELPSDIKSGLDRRSVSYIVLLKESAASSDDEVLLRQQVFERLNTGGIELENQEIRHCIYHNAFDDLLIELSRHPFMRSAWRLPLYAAEEDLRQPEILLKSPQYSKMRDVEFVLRCFALRHIEEYRGGMQAFLDQYMVRSRRFDESDIIFLRTQFTTTIEMAQEIYGEYLFRPWTVKQNDWAKQPQVAFADALMVALSSLTEYRPVFVNRRVAILEATRLMIINQPPGTFTGQGNTRESISNRIETFHAMLSQFTS